MSRKANASDNEANADDEISEASVNLIKKQTVCRIVTADPIKYLK